MQVIPVKTDRDFKAFLDVPKRIYKDDPEYVPHIRQELTKLLWTRPEADEVGLWLVKQNGEYIGRIAAFVNPGRKGGLGFFESIDSTDVANLLFRRGIEWLCAKDIFLVEAPVNYGERDKFWGLLVEGFKNPSYQENYNPPYYRQLFEQYGFEPSIVQSTQEINPKRFNLEKIKPLAQKVFDNSDFEIRCIERNNLDKYARDFATIYNAAWQQHEHFVPLTAEKVLRMMKEMKPVLREDLIWFTYAKGEPVAFYVSIIELNEIFRHLNGNLNLWGKLKFLWLKRRIKITRIRGLVFGVVPQYQGMGLTTGMMMKIFEVFQTDPYLKSSELAWIGDFNPRMLGLLRAIGAEEVKRHMTFQKNLKKV